MALRARQPTPAASVSRLADKPSVKRSAAPAFGNPLFAQQSALGNQALQRLLASGAVQPKMTVNRPGDRFEQEANRVADDVMRMPDSALGQSPQELQTQTLADTVSPLVQRQEEEEEEAVQASPLAALVTPMLQRQTDEGEEEVQTKPTSDSSFLVQRQEEEEEEPVQAKSIDHTSSVVSPAVESAIDSSRGSGTPLDQPTRSFFEPRLGADLSRVRIHADSPAADSARQLGAQAFTRGADVYFGAGRYQPHTPAGRYLLAHELTHTIQQGAVSPARSVPPARSSPPTSHAQAKPSAAGNAVVHPATQITPAASTGRLVSRQPAAATAEVDERPPDVVSLDGTSTFTPPASVQSWLEQRGNQGDVPVKLGNLAAGNIQVRKRREQWETYRPTEQSIPFTHPALGPLRDAEVQPVLVVKIRASTISGYASVARGRSFVKSPSALTNKIKKHSDLLGWAGLDIARFPKTENKLENGILRLRVSNFTFQLGGYLDGSGEFGLANETVTFNVTANVRVGGLADGTLNLIRGDDGAITGQVEVAVAIAKFSGNLLAKLENGVLDIRGTVGYADEKFSGQVTLLVTDAATARNVALEQLGPTAVAAAADQASGGEGGGGRRRRPRRDERALAGWGTLTFAFTDWLTGQAQVIIDNEGHITVIGEITPQAEVELFPQRDVVRNLFKVEVRARYGVPVVGNLFLFANIGMDALAKFGPGKIYNIAVRGRYSTDPRVFNEFTLEASLNISAFAGLRMRAEGGAGIEIASHDLKAGVGLNALAGVRGYVDATPKIGYRETAAPEEGKAGDFFLNGHLEIVAQPFLGLSGDLFVELDSPWWSPAPDKKWTWPIGSLEYPLPGQFGIGADVDYVIGSGQWPEIQFGEVDFNQDKFMTDLINDKVPPKSQGEQQQQGQWEEGQTTDAPTDPTLVDSQGTPSADQPAGGRQDSSDGPVPPADRQQRWAEGLAALGRMAEASKSDPLTREELDMRLTRIRSRYGFTRLRVEGVGEDFAVYPSMSPEPPRPVTIEGTEVDLPPDLKVGSPVQVKRGRGWLYGEITDIDSARQVVEMIVYFERAGDTKIQTRFNTYDETWRRHIPGTSYKIGAAWHAIRDLDVWTNFADARQVLNYRYHGVFNNPRGMEWNHLIEQSAAAIHTVENLAIIGLRDHDNISAYYARRQSGTGALPLRQWLRGQPLTVHRAWAEKAIRDHGLSLIPRSSPRGRYYEIS